MRAARRARSTATRRRWRAHGGTGATGGGGGGTVAGCVMARALLRPTRLDSAPRCPRGTPFPALRGTRASVCRARHLDPVGAERDEQRDDEQAREVDDAGREEQQRSRGSRARHTPSARFCSPGASQPRAVSARRAGPASQAARTKRSPTTTISRKDPRMSSVRMFQALPAACAIVAPLDERVDDVVLRQPSGDETDEPDDDDERADAADGATTVACEPDREPEGGERQEWKHPGERLQQLEDVLRRVELVGTEDDDLACVGGDPVDDLVADADPVGGLDDDLPQVEDDLALVGRDPVAAALEHLDERGVRLLEGDAGRAPGRPAARARDRRSGTRPAATRPLRRPTAPCSPRGAAPRPPPGRRRSRTARRRRGSRRRCGSGRCRAASSTCR